MKKIYLSLFALVLAFCFFVSSSSADWSVTVSWTRSVGPDLDYEECQLDAVVQCTAQETDPTTCNFQVADLTGQLVTIRSFNSQGSYADTTPIALQPVPSAAIGVAVTVVFIQP